MISEEDVATYLDLPVRIELTNGHTFDGIYRDWQLDVSDDVPSAMVLNPLTDMGLNGGRVLIEASRISSVTPLGKASAMA